MSKTIRQAYAAVIVTGKGKGREVPAGTPITLPEDEARRIADAFGVVEPTAPVRRARSASTAELQRLEDEVKKRADDLEEAAAKAEGDTSEANLAALDKAKRDLAEAEESLAEARE